MKHVRLGQTDLMVSRICFGCWQLSPRFWGDVPVAPWEQALDAALDGGVNFLDTANAYGDGYAESCLGNYFAKSGNRDRFVLATKFYWNIRDGERHPDTSPAYIKRECEASLRRLQTDRIDLYQIHAFDPLTRPDAVGETLADLQREGKIRWIGVSNLNPEQMRMYGRCFRIDSSQPPYSLLDRCVESDGLPYCLSESIGVIPYSPLYRGLLSGKYARDHQFEDQGRSQPALFHGAPFQRILDGIDSLRPIASGLGLTIAQLAIRWVLTHPAVTSAIVGIKTADHIQTICPAAEAALPAELWHHVAGIMDAAKQSALAPV
ncbi:MAG: aldo/keto reductase [Verrucomicrobia bacterium]|nr:aldo/keto reductase [Verrucomicrobiota bacterium]